MPSISYRVDIVLDKQCNGVIGGGADVYDTTVATTDPTNRFLNLYNEGRFTILKRWEGDLNPPSTGNVGTLAGQVTCSRDLVLTGKRVNIPMEFSGATGAIAEIRSNNIFVIYSASCTLGALGAAQCQLSTTTSDFRVRFLDL